MMNRIGFLPEKILSNRFQRLPLVTQALYFNILSRCDPAGVWQIDMKELQELDDTISVEEQLDLLHKKGHITLDTYKEKLIICDFSKTHYTNLRDGYNPHRGYFNAVEKHNLFISDDFLTLSFEETGKCMFKLEVHSLEKTYKVLLMNYTCSTKKYESSTPYSIDIDKEIDKEEKEEKRGIGGEEKPLQSKAMAELSASRAGITASSTAQATQPAPNGAYVEFSEEPPPVELMKSKELEFERKMLEQELSSTTNEAKKQRIAKRLKANKAEMNQRFGAFTYVDRYGQTKEALDMKAWLQAENTNSSLGVLGIINREFTPEDDKKKAWDMLKRKLHLNHYDSPEEAINHMRNILNKHILDRK